MIASYPDKNRSSSTLQKICRWVDETGSAVTGSGRPKSVLLQLVNILNILFKLFMWYWLWSLN